MCTHLIPSSVDACILPALPLLQGARHRDADIVNSFINHTKHASLSQRKGRGLFDLLSEHQGVLDHTAAQLCHGIIDSASPVHMALVSLRGLGLWMSVHHGNSGVSVICVQGISG